MRSDIFILGIMMVVIGPVLVAAAAGSCLLTILSGNVFACVNNLPVFIGGGALFVAGIITCLIGVIIPEPEPRPRHPPGTGTPPQTGQVVCKKCGRVNTYGLFSCPFCGQTARDPLSAGQPGQLSLSLSAETKNLPGGQF